MSRRPREVYGNIKLVYPEFNVYWNWMHDRAKLVGTDLTRDCFGYFEFVCELGPIPPDIDRPTVGRKDHAKGYVSGNYKWQEFVDNARENTSRNYSNKTGKYSEISLRNMSISLTGRTQSPERRNNTRLNCLSGKCSHSSHQHRRILQ